MSATATAAVPVAGLKSYLSTCSIVLGFALGLIMIDPSVGRGASDVFILMWLAIHGADIMLYVWLHRTLSHHKGLAVKFLLSYMVLLTICLVDAFGTLWRWLGATTKPELLPTDIAAAIPPACALLSFVVQHLAGGNTKAGVSLTHNDAVCIETGDIMSVDASKLKEKGLPQTRANIGIIS
ncbi:hypothetical protein Slin14017_G035740 [Septoria linicola]|nr:hypothetical protein Slin14017_G035740 [Septoria linicola]